MELTLKRSIFILFLLFTTNSYSAVDDFRPAIAESKKHDRSRTVFEPGAHDFSVFKPLAGHPIEALDEPLRRWTSH